MAAPKKKTPKQVGNASAQKLNSLAQKLFATTAAHEATSTTPKPTPAPAAKHPVAPVAFPDTSSPSVVFVHLEADDLDVLTDHEMAYRQAGIPPGTNGVNRSSIMRFALHHIQMAKGGELWTEFQTFAETHRAKRQSASGGKVKACVNVELDQSDEAKLTELEITLRRAGVAAGTNGVNRSSILRFALRTITPESHAGAFRTFCDSTRAKRLLARRNRTD